MFGWFFKKTPEKQLEGEQAQPVSLPVEPASPAASPEARPSPPLPPPEPVGDVPVAPPSSDDWASLMETPAESVEPVRPSQPVPSPPSPPPSAFRDSGKIPAPQGRDSGKIPVPQAKDSGKQSIPILPSAGETGELLSPGARLRAIPEKQPATPRGWNVVVLRTDNDGLWIARAPGEDEPLPVAAKEVLSLVYFDERKQTSFDCPILKVKAGNPEQVLVGKPLKSQQEKSKLDSIGSRQHFRIQTQLPVEVKIPGLAGRGIPPLAGHTRDISRGGLALLLPRAFESGRELDIRILSWNFPLQLKARVVRCDEEQGGRHVVAVAFPEDLSPITRDLINHFIMENQRGR